MRDSKTSPRTNALSPEATAVLYRRISGVPHFAESSKKRIILMRWCIYVDILGFIKLWESAQLKALRALRELMQSIYRIGTTVYADEGERLFVHHMGDGFAIVSDFGEATFERPLAIAAALMRHLAATGAFAAAAVSEGELSNITGCYPPEVMRDCEDGHVVHLNAGLMTLSSVMGTAFIRAYRLNGDSPSGPFVIISEEHRGRVPDGFEYRSGRGKGKNDVLSIDWVRSVNGGGIMLHAERPDGLVAAAQKCAIHGPLSVATRGGGCTAWSSMRRFDWRLSTRV